MERTSEEVIKLLMLQRDAMWKTAQVLQEMVNGLTLAIGILNEKERKK